MYYMHIDYFVPSRDEGINSNANYFNIANYYKILYHH